MKTEWTNTSQRPGPMELGSNQVLVTGAAGWLGQSLLNALVNGLAGRDGLEVPQDDLRIRCLVLCPEDAKTVKSFGPDRIEATTGDIRNAEDCEHFCDGASGAVLFHTAGIIHPRFVRQLYQVNVDGTRNLLTAAMAAGVRRAVVVSSNSPCGCNPSPDHLFDERSPYSPYMSYGRSKMQMELAVQECQEASRIETVTIRAPWFYGPYQPSRQTLFFEMIRDGTVPIVGDGRNKRSMAYVENLAEGLIRAAMTGRANGQTYWIADERPYTMNEIVDTVEHLLEDEFGVPCAHRRRRLPNFASGLAWLIDKTIQSIGAYHPKIHVLSEMNKTIACSIEKARAELGYRPTVSLEDGMRRSLRWCFDNGQWDPGS